MNHIDLGDTKVADQYKGAGDAFLVMVNGEPTKLIYENPECPPVPVNLNDEELISLFDDNDVDFDDLERKRAVILIGSCSCYQFAFPEVFINFSDSAK